MDKKDKKAVILILVVVVLLVLEFSPPNPRGFAPQYRMIGFAPLLLGIILVFSFPLNHTLIWLIGWGLIIFGGLLFVITLFGHP